MVGILLVTHGEFGAYLLEAAEEIVGRDPHALVRPVAISRRIPLAEVRQRLRVEIERMLEQSRGDGVLTLCDMLGGTPCNETLLMAKGLQQVEVLTGVNLYMAISALMDSGKLGLRDLAKKVREDGRRSVADAKEILAAKNIV